MKSHISITVDAELLRRLDRVASEERRSRSQAVEMAIEMLLKKEGDLSKLPVSHAHFQGNFSREETYTGR